MASNNVLVYRFSALGDVAMTVPVFKTLEQTDPDLHIYMVTQPRFSGLFTTLSNVTVIEGDIYDKHRGIKGLKRLYNTCVEQPFTQVIDLHNVIRTKLLSSLFKLNNKTVNTYNKRRSERREFLKSKQLSKPLPHISDLYLEAFRKVSNARSVVDGPWIIPEIKLENISRIRDAGLLPKDVKWICLAPFSKHGSKQWTKIKSLIDDLSRLEKVRLFCIAIGERETMIAKEWKNDIPGLYLITEGFTLEEQLTAIAAMDVMVSMDSANMHLAALVGTPVVSIWGPTHPDMGFGPLNNKHLIVQPSQQEAPWRPLSVYGKMRSKGETALSKQAMAAIPVEAVYEMTLRAAGMI